jgi:hypothetical protein
MVGTELLRADFQRLLVGRQGFIEPAEGKIRSAQIIAGRERIGMM